MPIELVVGFLFDDSFHDVVLIRKDKPAWQAGKFNGVGGKVEPDELPVDAMKREFNEEAGLDIQDWRCFATMTNVGPDVRALHCYWAIGLVYDTRTMEQERICVSPVDDVLERKIVTLGNLPWLVAMARAVGQGEERTLYFDIEESAHRAELP